MIQIYQDFKQSSHNIEVVKEVSEADKAAYKIDDINSNLTLIGQKFCASLSTDKHQVKPMYDRYTSRIKKKLRFASKDIKKFDETWCSTSDGGAGTEASHSTPAGPGSSQPPLSDLDIWREHIDPLGVTFSSNDGASTSLQPEPVTAEELQAKEEIVQLQAPSIHCP